MLKEIRDTLNAIFLLVCLVILLLATILVMGVNAEDLSVKPTMSDAIICGGDVVYISDSGVDIDLEEAVDNIPACAGCPPDSPCAKSVSDGCNTCTYQVWCSGERWYRRDIGSCTTVYCHQGTPLTGNPFLGGRQ